VRVEIRDLQRNLSITTLYVTHDQSEAMAVSDRIVVMNRGRIEQEGDPAAIYRRPRSVFVADFLGAANIVDAIAIDNGFVETPVGRFAVADTHLTGSGHLKLSWRPEDMQPVAAGTGDIHDALVRSLVFRGNFVELTVEAAGHLLRAQIDSESPIREGDRLSLAVAPGRARIVE
jgi:ABC-type Fe3+/spermidine/putrescine transport system ATPase subunit